MFFFCVDIATICWISFTSIFANSVTESEELSPPLTYIDRRKCSICASHLNIECPLADSSFARYFHFEHLIYPLKDQMPSHETPHTALHTASHTAFQNYAEALEPAHLKCVVAHLNLELLKFKHRNGNKIENIQEVEYSKEWLDWLHEILFQTFCLFVDNDPRYFLSFDLIEMAEYLASTVPNCFPAISESVVLRAESIKCAPSDISYLKRVILNAHTISLQFIIQDVSVCTFPELSQLYDCPDVYYLYLLVFIDEFCNFHSVEFIVKFLMDSRFIFPRLKYSLMMTFRIIFLAFVIDNIKKPTRQLVHKCASIIDNIKGLERMSSHDKDAWFEVFLDICTLLVNFRSHSKVATELAIKYEAFRKTIEELNKIVAAYYNIKEYKGKLNITKQIGERRLDMNYYSLTRYGASAIRTIFKEPDPEVLKHVIGSFIEFVPMGARPVGRHAEYMLFKTWAAKKTQTYLLEGWEGNALPSIFGDHIYERMAFHMFAINLIMQGKMHGSVRWMSRFKADKFLDDQSTCFIIRATYRIYKIIETKSFALP